MRPRARAVLGFALAPIAPALLAAIPVILHGDQTPPPYITYLVKVSYIAMLALGVPAYIGSLRRGWTGLPVYLLLGGVIGVAEYLFAYALGSPPRSSGILHALAARILFLPLDLASGVTSSIAFWLLARPDRRGSGSNR